MKAVFSEFWLLESFNSSESGLSYFVECHIQFDAIAESHFLCWLIKDQLFILSTLFATRSGSQGRTFPFVSFQIDSPEDLWLICTTTQCKQSNRILKKSGLIKGIFYGHSENDFHSRILLQIGKLLFLAAPNIAYNFPWEKQKKLGLETHFPKQKILA